MRIYTIWFALLIKKLVFYRILFSFSMVGLTSNLIVKQVRAEFILPTSSQQETKFPLVSSEELFESSPIKFNLAQKSPLPNETQNYNKAYEVKGFLFQGNTAISNEELAKQVQEFVGKSITFGELVQAASRIEKYYIEKGYITTGAYIPSQNTEEGIVTIQIVEGSLEEINVEVEGRLNSDYVRSRIAVATEGALNLNKLQEALQLLRLNPLIDQINSELSASTTPGKNILNVKVKTAKTFNILANLNNNRNPSVGTFQRGIQVSEGNLFGIGDEISFLYNNTDGSNEYEGRYSIPVNPYNGTVSVRYRNVESEIIERPFDELDIDTSARYFDFTFRQPVIQSVNLENNQLKNTQEFALGLTFSRWESDSTLLDVAFPLSLGADAQGRTRDSALRFFQEWTHRDIQKILAVRSQFNFGLGIFDATINEDQPDSEFFVWRGQMFWFRQLGDATENPRSLPKLFVKADLQLANDPLIPLEQFSLGGQATVRGYRQELLLTDSGLVASVELQIPIVQVPEVQGNLDIISFIDVGTGWNLERPNPPTSTLVGTGVGLKWEMGNDDHNFVARLDWGIPLISVDLDKNNWQENGIYFTIQYKFNPF